MNKAMFIKQLIKESEERLTYLMDNSEDSGNECIYSEAHLLEDKIKTLSSVLVSIEVKNTETKKLSKEDLLYFHKSISILDDITHSSDNFEIINEPQLTEEIKLLGAAVKRFEKITGIEIFISSN